MTLLPAPSRRPLVRRGLYAVLLLSTLLCLQGCGSTRAERIAKADAAVSMVDDAAGAALARVAEVEALLAKGEQLLKADTIGEKVLGAEKAERVRETVAAARAALPGAEAEAEKWKAALEEARGAAAEARAVPAASWQDEVAGYVSMVSGFAVLLPPEYRGVAELGLLAVGGLLAWSRSKWKDTTKRVVAGVDATLVRGAAMPGIIASPETAKKVMQVVQGPAVSATVDKLRTKGAGKPLA